MQASRSTLKQQWIPKLLVVNIFVPGATTIFAILPTSPFKMRYENKIKNVKFRVISEGGKWFHEKKRRLRMQTEI